MTQIKIRKNQLNGLLLIITLLSISLRLSFATLGHNFDYDSFLIVVQLMQEGKNVYANTTRYNYGPIWFNLLHLFDTIAYLIPINHETAFRYIIVFFLSLVDIGIALILWRKITLVTATIFLLNPISIIITGYHNQFDNLALLLGLISIVILGDSFDSPMNRRKLLGLTVLGLSLITKHNLFAFPIWLAVKQVKLRPKLITILLPILIFLASFIPFWSEGKNGIIINVFLYKSWPNAFFYHLFIPLAIQLFLPSTMIWLISLVAFAIIFRHKNVFETFLLYTCVVTTTSPAITNQYLAIPLIFISANINFLSILYTVIGTLHLLVDENGLHINLLPQIIKADKFIFYKILISLLFFELIWLTWQKQLMVLFKNIAQEISIQLTNPKK